MPRKYSPSEKESALNRLREIGSIPLTALHTNISERTLYAWRQQAWLLQTLQQRTPPPPLQKEAPIIEDDLEALTYLRGQIMAELLRLSSSFETDNLFTTPQQRVIILTQLVDRLIKLDAHLRTHPNAGDDDEIVMEHDVIELPDEDDGK
jgi:transposase-like protein